MTRARALRSLTGCWTAFGFCEYETPDAVQRCIRLLTDYEVCGKALLIKVDDATDAYMKKYEAAMVLYRSNGGQLPVSGAARARADPHAHGPRTRCTGTKWPRRKFTSCSGRTSTR